LLQEEVKKKITGMQKDASSHEEKLQKLIDLVKASGEEIESQSIEGQPKKRCKKLQK
jgi:hypothetical protein